MFIAEQDFTSLKPVSQIQALEILSTVGNAFPIVDVPYALLMKHFEYDDQCDRLRMKDSRVSNMI